MSFRKRSDLIGNQSISGRNPLLSRPVNPVPGRDSQSSNVGVPSRIPPTNSRIPPNRTVSPRAKENDEIASIMSNPGVRPSLITSQPTASTGGFDLDKILLHQGLPLGTSLLIEESGSTDFASVILRSFTSQGIIHNRIEKDQLYAHVIVVGLSSQWASELPGLYKGTSKEQKKAKILEHESKVSVSNLATSTAAGTSSRNEKDMKIAWRYGLNKKPETQDANNQSTYEHYNNQFDITQKLIPGPSSHDISFVPISLDFNQIIHQILTIINNQLKSNPTKIIRLVIPNLLNPSLYNPVCSTSSFIIPFVHSLRSILRKFSNNLILICSLPIDLYPRDTHLTTMIENIMDSVIHLQPFNQEMSQMIEKAYKNEPSKIQQGLVNIIKLPILSERGLMLIHDGEYAFKNGRKKFEIEEWGIPVEDDSKDGDNAQTTKNIDF